MIDFSTKDTMSPKERMAALAAGNPIDRVPFNPFSLGFSAKLYGIDRGEFYRNPDLAFEAGLNLLRRHPWLSARPAYGWADKGAWEFGGEIGWPDNDEYMAPFSAGPVITKPEDVATLPDPDPDTAGGNPLFKQFNAKSRAMGLPAALPGGTPTTMSSSIVGKSEFLRWMLKHPDSVHTLQRKVTDFIIRTAKKTILQYGAENCSVMCAVPMESNQLVSPKAFESLCKPYIQKIMGFYQSQGVKSVMVHLCGDHTLNLHHWSDIPLPKRTVFSIGGEMDMRETSEFLGKDFILAGNLSNPVLQTGTREQIVKEMRRCLSAGMRHPGGFILMPECEIPPDTPQETLEIIAEVLFSEGYY